MPDTFTMARRPIPHLSSFSSDNIGCSGFIGKSVGASEAVLEVGML